ncbi:MAG: hypothetical protein ACRBDL_02660 [Alphaproteobacteria bacterium]
MNIEKPFNERGLEDYQGTLREKKVIPNVDGMGYDFEFHHKDLNVSQPLNVIADFTPDKQVPLGKNRIVSVEDCNGNTASVIASRLLLAPEEP